MATRDVVDAWIPEEMGSKALVATQNSAVLQVGRLEPMRSDTKKVPTASAVPVANIAKGSAYGESDPTDANVLLDAMKIGAAVRIAEEDMDDALVNVLDVKKTAVGNGWAKYFDNAALGVTAASNGTTIPFTSVYRAVSQYNSASNLIQTAGALTFADLSTALGFAEASDYFAEDEIVVLAHPSFKGLVRGLADSQGRPLFVDAAGNGMRDTLLGYPVYWTLGAKTNATASSAPSGNPIPVVGPKDLLIVGDRTPLESKLISPDISLTDEAVLKVRKRVAFGVGDAASFGVIEITAS